MSPGSAVGAGPWFERVGAWCGAFGTLLILASIETAQRPSEAAMRVALAAFPYSVLVWGRLDRDPRLATQCAIGLAAVGGLALLGAPPLLSDDLYRYLWDARVARHGIDPYAFAPDDPALYGLRDRYFQQINHAEIPTIYPPVAQLVFGVAESLAHAPWSLRIVALGAHLVTARVVAELAGNRHPRAGALFALNPLALEEAALGGHIDAFAGLFLSLAGLAFLRNRAMGAALAVAAATGTKLIGLALVPWLALRPRAWIAAALLSAICVAPLLRAGYGSDSAGGLAHYASRWGGNAGGYAAISYLTQVTIDWAGRATGSASGRVNSALLTSLVSSNEGIVGGTSGPKKRLNISLGYSTVWLTERVSRALVVLLVLGAAITQRRRKTHTSIAVRNIVLCALFLAPQVHPWYLVWVLPLDLAVGGLAALTWSVVVLAAYSPLDSWGMSRTWNELAWITPVEYSIVVISAFMAHFGADCPRLRQ